MYDIYMDAQSVGQAEVIKEGLYYRFSCKCRLPDEGIYRITVTDGNNTKNLGICVPAGDLFCLTTRIPKKHFSGENLKFSLVPKDSQQTIIPVETNKPFADLDKLASAHLQESDGKTEIIIDPVPVPQGSDQSQESPHKWEQP